MMNFYLVERKKTKDFFISGEVNFHQQHDKNFTGFEYDYEK